jgi:hypothetical protein
MELSHLLQHLIEKFFIHHFHSFANFRAALPLLWALLMLHIEVSQNAKDKESLHFLQNT